MKTILFITLVLVGSVIPMLTRPRRAVVAAPEAMSNSNEEASETEDFFIDDEDFSVDEGFGEIKEEVPVSNDASKTEKRFVQEINDAEKSFFDLRQAVISQTLLDAPYIK